MVNYNASAFGQRPDMILALIISHLPKAMFNRTSVFNLATI
jgi:hypothetical protein